MAFKRINTGDQNLQFIQDNVEQALSPIRTSVFQNGVLLTAKTLTAGISNQIAHTLGRTPQVWVLVDQQQNATVWRTAWDSKFITLQCSANCTVAVWVA